MTARLSPAETLLRSVHALGGTWDTARSVTALRDGGWGAGDQLAQKKRAREAMRQLAKAGALVRAHAGRAIYRAAGDA